MDLTTALVLKLCYLALQLCRALTDAAHMNQDSKVVLALLDISCEKVGQIFADPDNQCSYMVCDNSESKRSSSSSHELLLRHMPCAPGTSVPADFRQVLDVGVANPCVEVDEACQVTPPPSSKGTYRKSLEEGGYGKVGSSSQAYPEEALSMMQLVWHRIEGQLKLLDHRKSLKSHSPRNMDVEQHMENLQRLWERMRDLVNRMVQRKVTGDGQSRVKGRKLSRSSREISGLKNLWISMWEKIRELESLDLEVEPTPEPLDYVWDTGNRGGKKGKINYVDHKPYSYFSRKNRRKSKKIDTNDIPHFDRHYPKNNKYSKQSQHPIYTRSYRPMYPKKAIPHKINVNQVYSRVDNNIADMQNAEIESAAYTRPERVQEHEIYYVKNKHNDVRETQYPHRDHHYTPQELQYLMSEEKGERSAIQHPEHIFQEPMNQHNRYRPEYSAQYDRKQKNYDFNVGDRQVTREDGMPGYQVKDDVRQKEVGPDKKNRMPPPPLEPVDEQRDLSLVPSGLGNKMPLNSLWMQMKDVLRNMMVSNAEELKNIPKDKEVARKKSYTQRNNNREQQRYAPQGRQGFSDSLHNMVGYSGARKAGSRRGPVALSSIVNDMLNPNTTTPLASVKIVSIPLPKNKHEFDAMSRKESASIDEKYERAKQEWRKIAQG